MKLEQDQGLCKEKLYGSGNGDQCKNKEEQMNMEDEQRQPPATHFVHYPLPHHTKANFQAQSKPEFLSLRWWLDLPSPGHPLKTIQGKHKMA